MRLNLMGGGTGDEGDGRGELVDEAVALSVSALLTAGCVLSGAVDSSLPAASSLAGVECSRCGRLCLRAVAAPDISVVLAGSVDGVEEV